jgi:hypothetical protein
MITRAIQPLTIKIEKLHSSHMRRYYKLKKVENRLEKIPD